MSVAKRYLSPNEYQRDIWRLAAKIRKDEWRPDVLIGLWRGGTPAAIAVHEYLKVTGWDVRHLPLKSASYTGIGQNDGVVRFEFAQEIFASFKPGERVLFVDDVFDTGKTAVAVRDEMAKTGAEMRLACVYWKPGKNLTDMKPDYVAETLDNGWIVFPHELEGLTPAEVAEKDSFLAELLR